MNHVTLMGRLGRDPEVRQTQGGTSVANVTLATSKKIKGEEKTEWHRVVFFGTVAELVGKYLSKGDQCLIEGELQTRKWQDKSGQDRYTTEVVVGGYDGRLHFIGNKKDSSQQSGGASGPSDLDEIPF